MEESSTLRSCWRSSCGRVVLSCRGCDLHNNNYQRATIQRQWRTTYYGIGIYSALKYEKKCIIWGKSRWKSHSHYSLTTRLAWKAKNQGHELVSGFASVKPKLSGRIVWCQGLFSHFLEHCRYTILIPTYTTFVSFWKASLVVRSFSSST